MKAQQPTVFVQTELVAGLPYDGVSTHISKAQDYEFIFDDYDIFIIEDIAPTSDAALLEFRSEAQGSNDPRGAEDFVVRVFENNGTGLPGQDGYTGSLLMTSSPGAGFYDLSTFEFVTDFGGQCLPAGAYFLVWAPRMDFVCCGNVFFSQQEGEPIVGGGEANNAWQWAPLDGYGLGTHFQVRDNFGTDDPRGVNYLLFGEPANCGDDCSNPDCPADLDGDADADSDDFFLYLDRFAAGDPCADIDGDTDADSDDFFAYLDLFAVGC